MLLMNINAYENNASYGIGTQSGATGAMVLISKTNGLCNLLVHNQAVGWPSGLRRWF